MSQVLLDRLQELHKLTAQSPLFNPVLQLSLDLSRSLEKSETDLKDIEKHLTELECSSLQSRASHLQELLEPINIAKNEEIFRNIVEESAKTKDFMGFRNFWTSPLLSCVFTAHPTFLLNRDQADNVANSLDDGNVIPILCTIASQNDKISLDYEHDEALAAIKEATIAREKLSKIIIETAQEYYPKHWQVFTPKPFDFATWVGYDMDGRTDISFTASIKYRLKEKAFRLEEYAKSASELGLDDLSKKLEAAKNHTIYLKSLFEADFANSESLSSAANELSQESPDKLLSLNTIIKEVESQAANLKDNQKITQILAFASNMKADGLGVGCVHFRLNSAQLNNAMRQHIGDEIDFEINSSSAFKYFDNLIEKTKPLRSNMAALAIETTTAIRQFLVMVQILRHIDADAPIRLLIAECEQPQTVLIALYFAKLFGIDSKIDISPLFETETAMEHGNRFLDALMGSENYRKYVRERGVLAIQTGFSDAGRFVGQVPAALAIERLHYRLAYTMSKHHLTDVKALIFNTHGESMGRGAHPSSIFDRLTYPMSVWARGEFAAKNIKTKIEVSFQGGDGYLFFRSPSLALATLTRIAEVQAKDLDDDDDLFYSRTDISLDFYRHIRQVQRDYLLDKAYSRAITAFGLGLLKDTGSRKSRRQFDVVADREMSLRQIRAIPHNAILQQLGYPINVLGGVGTAAKDNLEAICDLIKMSPRGQQLFRLFCAANSLSSIKTFAAYGEIFESAFWASRPYRGTEDHLENACLALAEKLENDDRSSQIRRLASNLRVDSLRFQRMLVTLDMPLTSDSREEIRRQLGVLNALRLCLMQFIFLKAVQIPAFSRRNDISRDDILEMIFSLRIAEAVELLRRAFVISAPAISDFNVSEPTDYPHDEANSYKKLHEEYFDKIEAAYNLIIRIGVAIANHYGAHG